MRNTRLIRAAALSLAATLAILPAGLAFAHSYTIGEIEIGHPWTRATPPSASVGGGYLTLTNEGDETDRIIGGSSPAAERVEIHFMEMEEGVMKMRKIDDGVEIAPGETVEFAPGGYHLMLIGLKEPIAEGDRVPVTLEFENGGTVDVELAAEAMGAPAMESHENHGAGTGHEGH